MPSDLTIPPGFVMILGGLMIPFVASRLRSMFFVLVPLVTLSIIWTMPDGTTISTGLPDYTLILVKVDSLSRIFAVIFAIITIGGGLYAFHLKDAGQQIAALLYGGGSIGACFAGDYITLFMFWELMAISSTYLIWARRTKDSEKAGMRYLIIHVVGGSVLLAGILVNFSQGGSLVLEPFSNSNSVGAWLILVGVCLNAAAVPIHAWLPDSYPKATVTGAVFLSAFTTKTAVYVLARLFPGWDILVVAGTVMALYGVVFAVLVNDIREILAYHIISQVGFMVAGIGIGTGMAINGSTAHAFSHILYKALLFMGAGVVLETTGRSKLSELGGLSKALPLALVLYLVGAFSISGFPLFNGFISKSMVVSAAEDASLPVVALLLHLASVGTFLSTTLKLPYYTWFGKKSNIVPMPTPKGMYVGMTFAATLCVLFGVVPSLLYRHLPFPTAYEPYTATHLVEASQMLVFTFIGFWLFRTQLSGARSTILDVDWLYRRPASLLRRANLAIERLVFDKTEKLAFAMVKILVAAGNNPVALLNRKASAESYGPHLDRAAMQVILLAVLTCFILIALWALFHLDLWNEIKILSHDLP
jgi:multicomponent Na+:H+ antiporter subunit D